MWVNLAQLGSHLVIASGLGSDNQLSARQRGYIRTANMGQNWPKYRHDENVTLYNYIHTYIHTYIRTYVRTYIHTYIHTWYIIILYYIILYFIFIFFKLYIILYIYLFICIIHLHVDRNCKSETLQTVGNLPSPIAVLAREEKRQIGPAREGGRLRFEISGTGV